ncbi:Aminopeptidase N [Formica fusca]
MKTGTAFLTLLLNSGLIIISASYNSIDYSNLKTYFPDTHDNLNRLPDALLPEDIINDTNNNYRLSNYTIPKHYDIWLVPIVKERKFPIIYGNINIDFITLRPTRTIDFHAQRPYVKIHDYALSRRFHKGTFVIGNLTKKSYNYESHILVLHFDTELPRGKYTLKMMFESTVDNEENFYNMEQYIATEEYTSAPPTPTRWPMFITFFQAIGARQIFPCWDEPNLKATFNIALRHNFSGVDSISNMDVYTIYKQHEARWSIYMTSPRMPTHSVMLSIYTFPFITSYSKSPKVLIMYYRHDANTHVEFVAQIAKNITQYLKSEWNYLTKESYTKRFVIIPYVANNDIAKLGNIILREFDNIYYKENDPIMCKIKIARSLACKMMQQWFGNTVSSSWWSYLWLNDGISMLIGIEVLNKILPNSRIIDLSIVQNQYESLHLDTNFIMKPLTLQQVNSPSEINSLFFHSHYVKALAVLRMLQHVLSDDVFKKGIEIYFNTYKYRSATLDNFWTAMQTAHDKLPIQKKKEFSIAQMMKAWTTKHHYPILKVKRQSGCEESCQVIISLEDLDTSHRDSWWIPVTITTEHEQDFDSHSHKSWLILTQTRLPFLVLHMLHFGRYNWIIVNIQQAGYYRVNYNIEDWGRLATYLNSEQYMKIHVLNRAKLIDDSFHLAVAGRLSYSIFWNISNYLHQEKDYIAWYPMFKAIEHMSSIFPFPTGTVREIKRRINDMLSGLLAQIGYQENPNDDDLTKCLRQEAAKWACTLGLPDCINTARRQLHQYIFTKNFKLLPWWKEWTVCNGIMTVTNQTYWAEIISFGHKIHMKYNGNNIPQKRVTIFECGLTCIKHTPIVSHAMNSARNGRVLIHFTLRINILFSIIRKHVQNNEVLDFMLSNIERFKHRKIKAYTLLNHIINNVYEVEQLDKIRKFVANNKREEWKEKVMDVEHKLKIRWSQIMRQQYYSAIFL